MDKTFGDAIAAGVLVFGILFWCGAFLWTQRGEGGWVQRVREAGLGLARVAVGLLGFAVKVALFVVVVWFFEGMPAGVVLWGGVGVVLMIFAVACDRGRTEE